MYTRRPTEHYSFLFRGLCRPHLPLCRHTARARPLAVQFVRSDRAQKFDVGDVWRVARFADFADASDRFRHRSPSIDFRRRFSKSATANFLPRETVVSCVRCRAAYNKSFPYTGWKINDEIVKAYKRFARPYD